jgi:hypothetical protein
MVKQVEGLWKLHREFNIFTYIIKTWNGLMCCLETSRFHDDNGNDTYLNLHRATPTARARQDIT